jgi:hypothetical protein
VAFSLVCVQSKPFGFASALRYIHAVTKKILALRVSHNQMATDTGSRYPSQSIRTISHGIPPDQRWFPAAEELRETAYEKLLPPLVAKVREEVKGWRDVGYAGASATSQALLKWWFETDHLIEQADGTQSQFRYYFAQREAVETVIWLHDSRGARDKFDLMRFDASGAVSSQHVR